MHDVIILAGGKGIRMGRDVSKPLVLARDREIIAWQLDNLYHNYSDLIGEVVVAVSFKAEEVKAFIKARYPDKDIRISFEETPLGTGGAIKQAVRLTDSEKVLVLNVDDISDLNLHLFTSSSDNRICITRPILPFGMVKEYEGYAEFVEKPKLENIWVSQGWYFINRREILNKFPEVGSVEYDVFQKGLMKLQLYYHTGFWRPLNSRKELEHFNTGLLPERLRF